jgi:hypothetical protein
MVDLKAGGKRVLAREPLKAGGKRVLALEPLKAGGKRVLALEPLKTHAPVCRNQTQLEPITPPPIIPSKSLSPLGRIMPVSSVCDPFSVV